MTDANRATVYKINVNVKDKVKAEIMRMAPMLTAMCKQSVQTAQGRKS